MKPPIFIRPHLGLGDAIIINGLVRVKAREHESLFVPSKQHNFKSVNYMWSDVENVHVIPVCGDDGAEKVCSGFAGDKLRLGLFGHGFEIKNWDKKFYEQAGVPFDSRWNEFRLPFMPAVNNGDYIFVHDDKDRGFKIDLNRVPPVNKVTPTRSETVFDWIPYLLGASEIHCIDSSFAILADSLPFLSDQKMVLHLYARNDKRPSYRKNWEILR